MTRQLKPIVGALMAGLIGVAQATCYYEDSYVCKEQDSQVGWHDSGCGSLPTYALTNWYAWQQHSTEQTGPDRYTSVQSTTYYCSGTIYYENSCTHQTQYATDATAQWYYRLDTNTPCEGGGR